VENSYQKTVFIITDKFFPKLIAEMLLPAHNNSKMPRRTFHVLG